MTNHQRARWRAEFKARIGTGYMTILAVVLGGAMFGLYLWWRTM